VEGCNWAAKLGIIIDVIVPINFVKSALYSYVLLLITFRIRKIYY